jgi:hypothetical protein
MTPERSRKIASKSASPSAGPSPSKPARFTDSGYGSPYIDMFWHCMSPEGGGVSIAGYVATSTNQNLPPQNFSVILKAYNAKGQKLTERFTYGDDLDPDQFEPVPLQVSLPAVAGAAKYDLYYDFFVRDGRDKLEQFGTVKDVCGGRYRRKEVPPGS